MKVAQHEVLGRPARSAGKWRKKRCPSRQGRSKRLAPDLSRAARQRKEPTSIVPSGTARL